MSAGGTFSNSAGSVGVPVPTTSQALGGWACRTSSITAGEEFNGPPRAELPRSFTTYVSVAVPRIAVVRVGHVRQRRVDFASGPAELNDRAVSLPPVTVSGVVTAMAPSSAGGTVRCRFGSHDGDLDLAAIGPGDRLTLVDVDVVGRRAPGIGVATSEIGLLMVAGPGGRQNRRRVVRPGYDASVAAATPLLNGVLPPGAFARQIDHAAAASMLPVPLPATKSKVWSQATKLSFGAPPPSCWLKYWLGTNRTRSAEANEQCLCVAGRRERRVGGEESFQTPLPAIWYCQSPLAVCVKPHGDPELRARGGHRFDVGRAGAGGRQRRQHSQHLSNRRVTRRNRGLVGVLADALKNRLLVATSVGASFRLCTCCVATATVGSA